MINGKSDAIDMSKGIRVMNTVTESASAMPITNILKSSGTAKRETTPNDKKAVSASAKFDTFERRNEICNAGGKNMDISRLGATSQYEQFHRVSAQSKEKSSDDKQAASSGSLFDKYLNAKKPRDYTSVVDVTYEHLSPSVQLHHDYMEWKQGQQDSAMPDKASSMEEKLAYVREHYGNASDALSIYDALNVMRDMSLISPTEYSWATGDPSICITKEEAEYLSSHALPARADQSDDYWHTPFMTSPLVGFHSLDDIFKWLDDFRKDEHPLSVSLEKARQMGISEV